MFFYCFAISIKPESLNQTHTYTNVTWAEKQDLSEHAVDQGVFEVFAETASPRVQAPSVSRDHAHSRPNSHLREWHMMHVASTGQRHAHTCAAVEGTKGRAGRS